MKDPVTSQIIEGRTVYFSWTPKKRFVKSVWVNGYGVTTWGNRVGNEADAIERGRKLCRDADRYNIPKM